MKFKKDRTKDQLNRNSDQSEDAFYRKRKKRVKTKYKHKSHWLSQDDNYEYSQLKDEEE